LVAGLGQGFGVDARWWPGLFDGTHAAGQAAIGSFVHRAHASLADQAQDFVSVAKQDAGF
jgi:hypothetical protein